MTRSSTQWLMRCSEMARELLLLTVERGLCSPSDATSPNDTEFAKTCPRHSTFNPHLPMLKLIIAAWSLVAATVIVHAAGLAIALRPMLHRATNVDVEFWPVTWLVIRTVSWLIIIHVVEIAVWALFYWWQKCLPDAESSFYFAGVTYTTVGYGDLVLPREWRLLGPVEGLAGILMCGLSTGFFFAVISRLYVAQRQKT